MDKDILKTILKDRLNKGVTVDAKAGGVSMIPMLLPGMLLRVEPCDVSRLEVGDIALFDRGDMLIAHRVLDGNGRETLFRGDSVMVEDGYVENERVVGLVVGVVVGRVVFSLRWFGARLYGKSVIALSPLSYRLNNALAWIVVKILTLKKRIIG